MEKDINEMKKMLRAIVGGQSSLRQDMISMQEKIEKKIDTLDENLSKKIDKVDKRVDTLGKDLAFLEDDAPTREEHDELESRVIKLEKAL